MNLTPRPLILPPRRRNLSAARFDAAALQAASGRWSRVPHVPEPPLSSMVRSASRIAAAKSALS